MGNGVAGAAVSTPTTPSPAPAIPPVVELPATVEVKAPLSAPEPAAPPVAALVTPEARPSTAGATAEPDADELPYDLQGLSDIHMLQYSRGGKEDSTSQAIRICLDLFIAANGNRDAGSINIVHMERFLDALAVWPKNRQNIVGYKDMSMTELLDYSRKHKCEPIAASTQEKYVQHLSAFFNRLIPWKRSPANPVLLINRRKHFGAQVIHSKRSYNNPEWQRPFDKDEMAAADAPWKFFGHLIPAFTGARSNEIGQLRRSDVRIEKMPDRDGVIHDVLCLHLGRGKKRKNRNAVRVVPIPKRVLDLGFERYLEDLDAFGEKDLFPGLRECEGRPGGTIESWFNGNLRTIWNILDPRVTFHCFRHTISTLMRNARTPASVRRALLGHSGKPRPGTVPSGNEVAENFYEDEITPLDILMELNRLPFPELDVAPYERGRFDHYLKCEGVHRRSNEVLVAAGKAPKAKRGPNPRPSAAVKKAAKPDSSDPALKTKRGRPPKRKPGDTSGTAYTSPPPGT
jgi:integrase